MSVLPTHSLQDLRDSRSSASSSEVISFTKTFFALIFVANCIHFFFCVSFHFCLYFMLLIICRKIWIWRRHTFLFTDSHHLMIDFSTFFHPPRYVSPSRPLWTPRWILWWCSYSHSDCCDPWVLHFFCYFYLFFTPLILHVALSLPTLPLALTPLLSSN